MFLAFKADILRSGVRRLEKLANILPNNHLVSTPASTGLMLLKGNYCYFVRFLLIQHTVILKYIYKSENKSVVISTKQSIEWSTQLLTSRHPTS